MAMTNKIKKGKDKAVATQYLSDETDHPDNTDSKGELLHNNTISSVSEDLEGTSKKVVKNSKMNRVNHYRWFLWLTLTVTVAVLIRGGLSFTSKKVVKNRKQMNRVNHYRCFLWLTLAAGTVAVLIAGGLSSGLLVLVFQNQQQQSQVHAATPSSLKSPSTQPSGMPSSLPTSMPGVMPTSQPSYEPSSLPSKQPSQQPSPAPSDQPSMIPSRSLSAAPSFSPSSERTYYTGPDQVTTFYAIGDAPYSDRQARELREQIRNLPSDAEFLVHVGDMRYASSERLVCLQGEYQEVSSILRESRVPVFIIPGDNDIFDCPNPEQGEFYWKNEFLNFDSRHWSHNLNVQRQPGRPENFAFVHKGTLFVGLNIVGGAAQSRSERNIRLKSEVDWTKELIQSYSGIGGRIVIFGHADPSSSFDEFFQPLKSFIRDDLQNQVPILYVNGDKHEFQYDPHFYGQHSFLRMMVEGNAKDPPLKIMVHANGRPMSTELAFKHDRGLMT